MRQIAFAGDVLAKYAEAEISFLVATSVKNDSRWDLLEIAIGKAEQELRDGTWTLPDQNDPFIESWHAAYRSYGLNPNRTRPSVEALQRRVVRDRRLPRINPAVDAYNLVSLRQGLPAGAFDLDAVDGDIFIRRARSGEPFRGIGGDVEITLEGEVVYADTNRVLTRGWNYRDCDYTKVTSATQTVLFLVERVSSDVPHGALDNALDQLESLITGHAHVTARTSIDRNNPASILPSTTSTV